MRYLVLRKGPTWSERIDVENEDGERCFMIAVGAGRVAAFAATVLTVTAILVQFVGLSEGWEPALWIVVGSGVADVPAAIMLLFVGTSFRIKDAQEHPVGSIRRGLLLRPYRIVIGGERYTVNVTRGGERAVLERFGAEPIVVVGDVPRQRYELKRGDEYVTRVFTYGLEPGPSFNVEMRTDDDSAPVIALAIVVEFRSRPHGRVKGLNDGFPWSIWS